MEKTQTATAKANSNIAFIKYWGNKDHTLRLPQNPSLSMCLDGLYTETTVTWDNGLTADTLTLNGESAEGQVLERVAQFLSEVRNRYSVNSYAHVSSSNSFPTGVGIASSASAFAALALASTHAAGLNLSERELTTLARLGSGSASRSISDGFVVWHVGEDHESSYAESIAAIDHWDITDVIAIVSAEHKSVGSTQGHAIADSSSLQPARVKGVSERLQQCQTALERRDFKAFSQVVEMDSNIMHAVMMTSQPALMYWEPASISLMKAVRGWREEGVPVCYTLDAGPNVHCLCLPEAVDIIRERLENMPEVQKTLVANPGPGARIIKTD